MIALLANVALAQQDAALCKGGFSDVDWTVRLDSAEDALGSLDLEVARRLLTRTHVQMPCLQTIADRTLLARFAQDLAWLAYLDQDEAVAIGWLLLARSTSPGPLPEHLPPRLRELDTETEDPPFVGLEGRLVPPKGGGIFLDGKLVLEPGAPAEVPGLLQVADGSGRIVATQWVDSGVIPEEWLGPDGPPPRPPRWYSEDGSTRPQTLVARPSNAPAIAPLAASGGLVVLSGTLYALGGVARGSLAKAETEDALAAARSRTNLLAMGAFAVGAGAVGVGVYAFVSADGSIQLSVRF